MKTNTPHINRSAAKRTLLTTVVLAFLTVATPAQAGTGGGYAWPVKPFDGPHPVRAQFGDPRTTFAGPATEQTLMTSGGVFAFHFGIDIAVADGTPAYAVRDGVATLIGTYNVSVDSGHGFVTQYWHLVTAVKSGQRVEAFRTVLGRVQKGYEHVHFAELDHGKPVNPLAAGHLRHYRDTTRPVVSDISFRTPNLRSELLPELVRGTVVPVVRAADEPELRVPGRWADLPTAPARLTWHVERVGSTRRVAVRERTAFDVRSTLPPQQSFWQHYARGTRQNMCTFGKQRAWRVPGVYLYRLTPNGFDTTRLPNGIYEIVVTAHDLADNTATARQTFIVRNGTSV